MEANFLDAATSVQAQMEGLTAENDKCWHEVATLKEKNAKDRSNVARLRATLPHRQLGLTKARMAGDQIEAGSLSSQIQAQALRATLSQAQEVQRKLVDMANSFTEDIQVGEALMESRQDDMTKFMQSVRATSETEYRSLLNDTHAAIEAKRTMSKTLEAQILAAKEATAHNVSAAAAADENIGENLSRCLDARKIIAQNRLTKKALRKERSIVEPRATEAAKHCLEEETQYNALKQALQNAYAT